jgi:hypothetical protein
VTPAYITARKPGDIAREVERLCNGGCRAFVISRLGGDGMLDRERLGAARYAAGLQAEVELEAELSPAPSPAAAAASR